MAKRVQILLDDDKHERLTERKPRDKTWEDILDAGMEAVTDE